MAGKSPVERYEEALEAYREDASDSNRSAYRKAAEAVAGARAEERSGRAGTAVTTEKG